MIAAVVQMTSGSDLEQNLARATYWVERAASAGAELVALPENLLGVREESQSGPHPPPQDLEGPVVARLRGLSKRLRITLCAGTIPECIPSDTRTYNTSLLWGPEGELLARYRKIHLFDVELEGASLRESRTVAPGEEVIVASTPLGPIGLSICYDLRFPELYRTQSARGARILLIPSAFTVPTGRDHWEVLLRARAIENQCFVLAPGQYGQHNPTRRSYGRSMIVDPWGTVLATVPDREGYAVAELDMAHQDEIRRRLPALQHRRL